MTLKDISEGVVPMRERVCSISQLICFVLVGSFFVTATQSSPALAEEGLEKAIHLADSGSYKEALLLLHSSLKKIDGQSHDAARNYYYQGVCYQRLGHPDEAKQCFDAAQQMQSPRSSARPPVTAAISSSSSARSTGSSSSRGRSSSSDIGSSAGSSESSGRENLSNLPAESKIRFLTGEQGHMLVDAYVNGRPIRVMFDTGAPGVLLGTNHLSQLGLSRPSEAPTTSVRGWAGKGVPAWEKVLDVRMGDITRRLLCTIMDSDREEPLVGYAFVEGLPYEIDQKGRCMVVRNPAAQQSRAVNPLYDIPCRIVNTKPVVPVRVEHKTTDFFIDTGASSTIMNYSTFLRLGMEMPSNARTMYGGGVGGSVAFKEVEMDITFGPIHKSGFPVMVGGAAGNAIGQDFLEGWKFTVDDKQQLLRFFH